jgi:hypothetical protein
VNVLTSRFASAEGAYGFFTKRVVADGDPADGTPKELAAGAEGALGSGIAYVWRGDIVAELSYANELETPDQLKATSAKVLPELARQLGDQLPGDVNPLPAVRLLPQERLIPMGISYQHRDALGVTGLGAGALVTAWWAFRAVTRTPPRTCSARSRSCPAPRCKRTSLSTRWHLRRARLTVLRKRSGSLAEPAAT